MRKQELTFDQLGLKKEVLEQIKELGYENPTQIQEDSIPHVLERRDFLGQAQTGTGKTAAFALPILSNLKDAKCKKYSPDVLVLAPTRELAIQVAESFKGFAKKLSNIKVTAIYGGQDYKGQIRDLQLGVNIVVGTTGRVMDHMKNGKLFLENLKCLVLDEADEMLRMGFIDDVKTILSETPDSCQRLLFSATMPRDIQHIVNSYLRDPVKVQIKSTTNTAATIRQRYILVRGLKKMDVLDRILSVEKTDGVIIFVKTKADTVTVASSLKELGYNSASMSGDMSQQQRELILNYLKSGKVKILIATDVVARGLDVDCISHVINYELPTDHEAYVHRIGRTGRAGREGDAISLVLSRELRQLNSIERTIKVNIEEMEIPTGDAITTKRVNDFKRKILEVIGRNENLEKYYKICESILEENENLNEKKIIESLIFLSQKDKPLFVDDLLIKFDKYDRNESFENNRRSSRNDRFDRNRRQSDDFEKFKINIGENDGIEKRNIFGAIVNQGGINPKSIGQIRLYDNYSIIKISGQVSNKDFDNINKVKIMGKNINVERA